MPSQSEHYHGAHSPAVVTDCIPCGDGTQTPDTPQYSLHVRRKLFLTPHIHLVSLLVECVGFKTITPSASRRDINIHMFYTCLCDIEPMAIHW